MSNWDNLDKYHIGAKFSAVLDQSCEKTLKKSGVYFRVAARVLKICETGNFGTPKTGFKYDSKINIGWLKWPNGTRVYYTIQNNNKMILLLASGSKNKQVNDIKKAKEVKNGYEKKYNKN